MRKPTIGTMNIQKHIKDKEPKKKKLVNFRIEEEVLDKLSSKLKMENIRISSFFQACVYAYLETK